MVSFGNAIMISSVRIYKQINQVVYLIGYLLMDCTRVEHVLCSLSILDLFI